MLYVYISIIIVVSFVLNTYVCICKYPYTPVIFGVLIRLGGMPPRGGEVLFHVLF